MFASILKKQKSEPSEFSAEPQTCTGCLWRRDGITCDAFPNGIPGPILFGVFDHTAHYEDEQATDDGLTFSPAQ